MWRTKYILLDPAVHEQCANFNRNWFLVCSITGEALHWHPLAECNDVHFRSGSRAGRQKADRHKKHKQAAKERSPTESHNARLGSRRYPEQDRGSHFLEKGPNPGICISQIGCYCVTKSSKVGQGFANSGTIRGRKNDFAVPPLLAALASKWGQLQREEPLLIQSWGSFYQGVAERAF